eukprot:TRINITY_DN2515_c0_g2_i3.p1 TRINITY_DN2515_c0_g2~~TRINITY_DN2515_c0_g2_i3.p1  ORF type:complete len:295 (-),score=20.35 TRINITY_DN2515_c0_g2_i3:410-1294(-)
MVSPSFEAREEMKSQSPLLNVQGISVVGKNDGQAKDRSKISRRGAIAGASYMICAVLLVLFNKAALSSYAFPCSNIVTVLQMICSTTVLYILRSWNLITFSDAVGGVDVPNRRFVTLNTLKQASPLSISYLFYMVVGMAAVKGVNVPMYTALRRTTVFFTMVMEYLIAGQSHTFPVIASVAVILFGAVVAGARDFSYDTRGYGVVFLSNLTTAIYLATISRLGKSTGLNSFGLMWCNGLICGPLLFLWTLISGELSTALRFPALNSLGFQVHSVLCWLIKYLTRRQDCWHYSFL